ncbi:MAG: hypothetical protein AAF719_01175 [Pseudomonadota bacterium]
MERKLKRLEAKRDKLTRQIDELALTSYGGTQKCPWCGGSIQTGEDWFYQVWWENSDLDIAKCGVCGGTSLWRFEMGAIFVGPHLPNLRTRKGSFWSENWRNAIYQGPIASEYLAANQPNEPRDD